MYSVTGNLLNLTNDAFSYADGVIDACSLNIYELQWTAFIVATSGHA